MAAAVVVTVAALVGHQPDFYRRAVGPGDPQVEQQSRRLVSKVSALQASWTRTGDWEAVLDEDEINAWLATDLPRNHSRLLPAGMADPRVALEPGRIVVAVRVSRWSLSVVATCRAEVVLRDVNRLGVVVEHVSLGRMPLPVGPVLRDIVRRLSTAGLPTDLRRIDGRQILVISLPAAPDPTALGHTLDRLTIDTGSVVFAGRTIRGGAAVAAP